MMNPEPVNYRLTIYSAGLRLNGESAIPSQRRLSDVANDAATTWLTLTHVIPSVWRDGSFRDLPGIDSITLLKDRMLAIIPAAEPMPPNPAPPTMRSPRVPFRVAIHLPPLLLRGDLHISEAVGWPNALNAWRGDFLPITDVTILDYDTRSQVETSLELAVVNRHWIVGIEAEGNGS